MDATPVTPRVVAAWRDANDLVVQVREDGSMRAVQFDSHTNWMGDDSRWTPPVAEPVIVADAPEAHTWTCYQCNDGFGDAYRNLPSATRCGRCGSPKP
jgi:hypothetical protein